MPTCECVVLPEVDVLVLPALTIAPELVTPLPRPVVIVVW
jgi:hypothetical protein